MFGSRDVTGEFIFFEKRETIIKGFIYGAAVVFTTIDFLPYIEVQNISFWLENCDVSVASIAFSKTPTPLTYNIGASSKTTTAYGTNIASECADHVIYTYVVKKKNGLIFENTLNPAWLIHNIDALTFTISPTSITETGEYQIEINATYNDIGISGTVYPVSAKTSFVATITNIIC